MKLAQALVAYGLKNESIDSVATRVVDRHIAEHLQCFAWKDERTWLLGRLRSANNAPMGIERARYAHRIDQLEHMVAFDYVQDVGSPTDHPDYHHWSTLAAEYRRIADFQERSRRHRNPTLHWELATRMEWIRCKLTEDAPFWSPLT